VEEIVDEATDVSDVNQDEMVADDNEGGFNDAGPFAMAK
jgi:hypothetical protein